MSLDLRTLSDGVEIAVHVRPRASREGVGGLYGSALQVRVHAAPSDGAANRAVCEALARALGVRKRAVDLVSGPRSRRKRVRVAGDPTELSTRLLELADSEAAV